MSYLVVGDVMSTDLITVKADTTIKALADLLTQNWITGVPVVGNEGELIGEVSLTDIAHSLGKNDEHYVRDIMVSIPLKVSESFKISEVADVMIESRIHRILVVRDDRLIGIVTSLDLLKALRK
jgi:CBS domain-containing protein